MELFTDGFPEFFTPVGVGVAVLLQVLISLFSLQLIDCSMGEWLVEKFRNLHPYIMGGQAERI